MRRARAAPLARSELCASCRHTAVDSRAASMLVLTCCVRSESSPRRCERDALLLPLLLCRSLAQAWMHRAVRADAGVLRQCGHFWRWRMSAGQSARCPELLLCIADVCLSLAHVSRALAPRYHVGPLARVGLCARVACSPRVRRESHVRVRICIRPAPRGAARRAGRELAPVKKKKVEKIKREQNASNL